jgi:hypothetical protein
MALLASGCGGGGAGKAQPIKGPAKQAAAVVQRLERATAAHDYATICTRLFSRAARAHAGGRECARLLAQRAAGVKRPRIEILSIEVAGPVARVHVRTTAAGQKPVRDVLRLRRERGRFRIASLGR